MANLLKTITTLFLDIIFPIKCLICRKELNKVWLCQNCQSKLLEKTVDQRCPICFTLSENFRVCRFCRNRTNLDALIPAFDYENKDIQKLIHAFKYSFVKDLGAILTKLALKALIEEKIKKLFVEKNFLVIPMPLHRRRLNFRGFNQSEIIAQIIAEKFGLELSTDSIFRRKNTKPQINIENPKLRKRNIKNAFRCLNTEILKSRDILLVDDVATSLSTLNECAKILKQNKAREIWGFVIAKARH